MNGKQTKKLIWETNTPPPTNYIWVKPNGKPYEFNNSTKKWEESNCFGGISENMSEEQQMEVRKNLGLYYEETSVGEKTVQYNGEEMSFQDFGNWAKISDDTPAKTNIVSIEDIPASDETNVAFFRKTDGYEISPIGAPSGVHYRIVLNDSEGHEPGIYYDTIGAEYSVSLVYKGEITTVSKIDAKFLPEQESGSSLPWLDVAALQTTNDDEVDISSNISQSDYNDLLDGKYIGIHVLPNTFGIECYYTILNVVKAQQGFVSSCIILGNFSVVGFDADNQNKRILYLIGSDVTRMYIRNVTLISEIPGPIVLNGLPETSITNQVELDILGITGANVRKLVTGEASGLSLKNSGGLITTHLNLEVAEYNAVNNYDLRFTDKTHRYSVSNTFDTITVTKTSLS